MAEIIDCEEKQFQKFLHKLQCQFLCCYPVRNIEWDDISNNISWEQQEQLLHGTYGHPLNGREPVKIAYQLNFLKRLLQQLEKVTPEVHDCIYESYCQVQKRVAQDATEKYAYKHYLLPAHSAAYTLRESKSFVAEGTTGLCSWQASLALADYLLQHAELVRGKSVLELGAGTGLCGLILAGCCRARRVLLTDGSAECIESMRESITRNFPAAVEQSKGNYLLADQQLKVRQLEWSSVEEARDCLTAAQGEVLLAADVVYDDSVFADLTNAIDYIFSLSTGMQMYLAATVRNEHTLRSFLQLLEQRSFHVEERVAPPAEQSNLHWDRTTPVKILAISKS